MFRKNKKKIHKRHPRHEKFNEQIEKDVKFAVHTQHEKLNHSIIAHIFTFIMFFVVWLIVTIRLPSIPLRYFSILVGLVILLLIGSYISKQDFMHK